MHAATETELKLAVSAAAMRRLAAHALLRPATRPLIRRLRAVYFDTPEFDLRHAGIALRVRRDGGRWIQTLKGGGAAQAGLHRRLEAESEVAGAIPDVAAISGHEWDGVLSDPQMRARLRPVFVATFTRSSRLIEVGPGVAVEACLDRGEIRAGDLTEPLCELELELKAGAASHLFDFALRLLEVAPLSMEPRSKAERGYALARRVRPEPAKARAVPLVSTMTASDAFAAIAWASLGHLLANERGLLAGDEPEYLHQMRVALRRLRSALRVFAPVLPRLAVEPIATELRWLAAALGPARDWDVFVTETLPPVLRAFAQNKALAQFARACAARRDAAGRRARTAVASARYRRLVLETAKWLCTQGWVAATDDATAAMQQRHIGDFAAAMLGERHARVRKRGRGLPRLAAADLHRLRIAVKKLRYAADFFGGLYGPGARGALKRLARLQDILGAMNDAATAAELTRRGGGRSAATAEARGIVLGWSRRRADALRGELGTAWKAYCKGGKFW